MVESERHGFTAGSDMAAESFSLFKIIISFSILRLGDFLCLAHQSEEVHMYSSLVAIVLKCVHLLALTL